MTVETHGGEGGSHARRARARANLFAFLLFLAAFAALLGFVLAATGPAPAIVPQPTPAPEVSR